MYEFSGQPLRIGQILSQSIRQYVRVFTQAMPLCIVATIAMALPQFFQILHSGPVAQLVEAGKPLVKAPTPPMLETFIISFAMLFVTAFFVTLTLDYVYRLLIAPNEQIPATIGASFRYIRSKLKIILPSMLIYTLLLLIAFFALIFPGIFLGILLLFYTPSILFHHKGILSSISNSASLVWGNWWRTLTLTLSPILLASITTGLVVLVIGKKDPVFTLFLQSACFAITLPLINIVLLLQYNDLCVRRSIKEATIAAHSPNHSQMNGDQAALDTSNDASANITDDHKGSESK